MTFIGQMRDGVVVFPGPVAIPDGAEVSVEVVQKQTPSSKTTLRERLLRLAGTVDDLPTDMAKNHDHYLHGAPKK